MMMFGPGRKRPLLLDLFCGEGGSALGYYQAGFDVVGVDMFHQKRFPYTFIKSDVFSARLNLNAFDAVHASPPCQVHSSLRHLWTHAHTNLIPQTLELLSTFHGPWVVENVPGAVEFMPGAVTVCGCAVGCFIDTPYPYFLRRHRLFMSNAPLVGSGCECARFKAQGYTRVDVVGESGNNTPKAGRQIPGENVAMRRRLMKVPHASAAQIAQAVPAPYTRFIGRQLLGATVGT